MMKILAPAEERHRRGGGKAGVLSPEDHLFGIEKRQTLRHHATKRMESRTISVRYLLPRQLQCLIHKKSDGLLIEIMTLTKSSLRSSCITKRDAISIENHETWSFAVCEKLATYLSTLPVTGKQLALYNATHSEVDIAPVLHALDAEGITVGLPVVQASRRELAFYRFFSTLPMTQGAFGILEPQHFEQISPDIIIVPLVGFDRTGQRLGYGKGYYDATLAALHETNPTLLAIGVAFSAQEVDSIPADRHDEKLNLIITEKEIISV